MTGAAQVQARRLLDLDAPERAQVCGGRRFARQGACAMVAADWRQVAGALLAQVARPG